MVDTEMRWATRLPDYPTAAEPMPTAVSDIEEAARIYADARVNLKHLQNERNKIDDGITAAMGRMDEAAVRIVSIIHPTDKRAA